MRINEREILDRIMTALEELRAVPKVQMVTYIKELTGIGEDTAVQIIEKYGRQHVYLLTDFGLQLTAHDQLSRKTAMGMWAYMFLASPVGEDFRLAKWPASLLFRKDGDENLYRVVICDSPEYDRDLAALKEMKDSKRCINVIVGEGFDVKDISTGLLPESTFIYLRLDGNPLTERPECNAVKVKLREE